MPIRELTNHQADDLNKAITVQVMDEPTQTGANTQYKLSFTTGEGPATELFLQFQNGDFAATGVNGITREALIAVLIDNLRGLQSGDFACIEHANALNKLGDALQWLNKRTRDLAESAEGTAQA